MLLLDLALHQLAELIDAFEAKRFGELVVGLRLGLVENGRHLDVKGRRLALQALDIVVLGEGHFDDLFIAGLEADELILEAGDKPARADLDLHALTGATVERNAVDLAGEVHDDDIAGLRLVALGMRGKGILLRGDALHRLVHSIVARLNRQTLQLQAEFLDLGRGNLGQDFKRDLDLGILAEREAFVQFHRRLHRGTQLVVGDDLLHAFLDRAVERVRLQTLAVHLANEVGGHLAGTETGHTDLRRDVRDFAVHAGVDVLGGNGEGVGALQAFVQCLDSLHFLRL
jgi:hypothetical protein